MSAFDAGVASLETVREGNGMHVWNTGIGPVHRGETESPVEANE